MTAPAAEPAHPHHPLAGRGAPRLRAASGELGRHRFLVVAGNVTDTVRSIGGLIFDRAMAGWEVSVVVDGDPVVDDRPLRILGARVAARWPDASHERALSRAHLLAVATDVMVRSDAVRRQVLAIGDDGEADVLLWGRHHPTNMSRTFVAVRHQPSAAAHVFKAHAMLAGGVPASSRTDEACYVPA